jgi:ABC-type multidrug transport system ATPase subunit
MATIPSVEVRGLYKHYGTGRVLSGIDLTLHAGQATLLLGDNGAGKSTLLNILGTLIRPSRGTVLYGGRRSDEIDAADLR